MNSLLALLSGALVIVVIAYWLLFFLVVKVRIADKGLEVEAEPGFKFLWERWPYAEMRAYRRDLGPDEARRPLNGFLLNALTILRILVAANLMALLLREGLG